MHELSPEELRQAIEYAESIDESAGRAILEKFQADQPELSQTVFTIFPAIISEQSQDMAYLFMNMCFDTLCVYQYAFGKTPVQREMGPDWLEKQAALLDAELQALAPTNDMEPKLREKLQQRLAKRAEEETVQHGLINFMNNWIDEFIADYPNNTGGVKTAQTMIFVAIRLFSSLYSAADKK